MNAVNFDILKYSYYLLKLIFSSFYHLGFARVEDLVGTKWANEIGSLSSILYEPFFIRDFCCDEFDTLLQSKDNIEEIRYIEILRYLDRCFQTELISRFYVASVMRARARHDTSIPSVKGVESSFCLSLRKYSWIPVNGQLMKPTDVYLLPPDNPFIRYIPHFDRSKIPLKNVGFIKLLGFQQKITPMTIFELLMKWSCNLDRDSLWQLVKVEYNQPLSM